MTKLLKEPLIHFLGGALLVFGFFWATGANRDPADYSIIIDQSDVDRLRSVWIQNFRRPPTQAELDGLIEQEIVEEIYYREALRLGMDRNDAVIRRRMFTKMRFLNNEDATDDKPSDATLRKWMDENPGRYASSSLYDFDQIYLGQANDIGAAEIERYLKDLNAGNIISENIMKPLSLPPTLKAASIESIARQFGEQFAEALENLKIGQWDGPVLSGFGLHLVKVSEKIPGKTAVLDDVRQSVTNDWRAAQRENQERKALEKYRSQYDIQVAGRK